jgi:hypothetical protein
MGELVDGLVRKGWVSRQGDPDDRRRVLVLLTETGAEALDRGRRLRQAWLAEAMTVLLDAEERRTLITAIGLLERIVLGQAGAPNHGSGMSGQQGSGGPRDLRSDAPAGRDR